MLARRLMKGIKIVEQESKRQSYISTTFVFHEFMAVVVSHFHALHLQLYYKQQVCLL